MAGINVCILMSESLLARELVPHDRALALWKHHRNRVGNYGGIAPSDWSHAHNSSRIHPNDFITAEVITEIGDSSLGKV